MFLNQILEGVLGPWSSIFVPWLGHRPPLDKPSGCSKGSSIDIEQVLAMTSFSGDEIVYTK